MEHKYTAIVLDKKDVGESDRLYIFYTLEKGKITAMARGVRKAKSKLAGKLENFYFIDLTVMKNRGMGNIASSIVENDFRNLHNNFYILEKVFDSIKTINRLISDEDRDIKVFKLLLEYLEVMNFLAKDKDDGKKLIKSNLVKLGFIFKFLDLLGYKIEASKCIESGERLKEKNNYFNYAQGGMISGKYVSRTKNTMAINSNSIKIIRIFFNNNLKSLSKLNVNKRDVNEIGRMVKSFIAWIC